jgi:ABC-type transport system substrate-binding protein
MIIKALKGVSPVVIFYLCVSGWCSDVNKTQLDILLLNDGSLPYSENVAGGVLSTFNYAVMGSLLDVSSKMELIPSQLESWYVNAQSRTIDLTLRKDLKFHDGSEVTASDLEFSLLRGYFSTAQSFYKIYLSNIEGIDQIRPGEKFRSGRLDSVKVIDRLTLRIRLKVFNPSFLYIFTRPFFHLCRKEDLKDDLLTWKQHPIGVGPFRVSAVKVGSVLLERFVDQSQRYKNLSFSSAIHIHTKYLPGINYDLSFFEIPELTEKYHNELPASIFTLFFTNQNELAKASAFREAVQVGINRRELISGMEFLKEEWELLPSAFWRGTESIKKQQDIKRAMQLISTLPKNEVAKTWKIPVYQFGPFTEEQLNITNRLKRQFLALGLKFDFFPSNEKFLSKDMAKDSPFSLSGRICNNVDPLLMFKSFKTGSPFRYEDDRGDQVFDKLFEKGEAAVDTESRITTLRQISKYTVDNNFMVPLYSRPQIYHYNPDRILSFGDQAHSSALRIEQLQLRSTK